MPPYRSILSPHTFLVEGIRNRLTTTLQDGGKRGRGGAKTSLNYTLPPSVRGAFKPFYIAFPEGSVGRVLNLTQGWAEWRVAGHV
ncbi:hypothetical protein CEXT_369441 [Caerostris extrusa]|uniref:Uncharacterized protein n=1 Tax=Caerostris extrusa TaxID=172846 RepID=A0AAV4SPI9_CAEEX|nr:hypothetical protein CEXT_369441 [Caerostris extrusa]